VDYGGIADEALTGLLAKGDEAALVELMRRHQKRVFGMAYRYVGNHDDAADVTQEVFVKVFQSAGAFSARSRFTTWLFRVTVNVAITALRRRKRWRVKNTESLDALREDGREDRVEARIHAGPTPLDSLQQKELGHLLQANLNALSDSHRMVFILRELRQMSYKEIADAMGVPEGGVRSRLHLARKQLRENLAPYLAGERHPSASIETKECDP